MKPAIQTVDLSREFRRRQRKAGLVSAIRSLFYSEYVTKKAVTKVSLEIPSGSCVGLVGANGAGKTTLLKMLSGLLHPSSGQISVLGFEPAKRDRSFQKQIGMVMGQKSQLWVDIPALETFELLASIYQVPETRFRQRLSELTQLFGVEHLLNVQVRRLSLGERMKLEIIAALLHEPKLLILDEPTIGLDVLSKRTIRRFIKDYNHRSETTIILSSHDMTDISEVCDRLVLIAQGEILYQGLLKNFERFHQERAGASRQRELSFVFNLSSESQSPLNANELQKLRAEVLEESPAYLKLRLPSEKIADAISQVFRSTTPLDIRIENQDLENLIHEVMHNNPSPK